MVDIAMAVTGVPDDLVQALCTVLRLSSNICDESQGFPTAPRSCLVYGEVLNLEESGMRREGKM